MIDAAAIHADMLVYVGLGIERAGVVVGLPKRRDGRVFARVRLYRTDIINDYPLSVVRAMTEAEAEAFKPKPKKRKARPRKEREAKKASVPVPPSRGIPVSIFDIGKAAGFSETAVLNALRKSGVGGE